jgi:hypothetical protein
LKGWTDVSIGCPGDRQLAPRFPMVTHLGYRQSRGEAMLARGLASLQTQTISGRSRDFDAGTVAGWPSVNAANAAKPPAIPSPFSLARLQSWIDCELSA